MHLGEAGQVACAPGAAGVHGQEQRREDDDRREELRAAEGLADRAPPERRDTRLDASRAQRARRSRSRRVVAAARCAPRRPRGGGRSSRRTRRRASAARARATRRTVRRRRARARSVRRPRRRRRERDHRQSVRRRHRVAEAREDRLGRSTSPSAIDSSRCGSPIWPSARRACPRRPSCPSSMIPTRSASWSASSRYCVVRKTVVPSSFRRRTSSQIAMRLTGVESGRRLVEEQHARARARARCARSSRRRMPPE